MAPGTISTCRVFFLATLILLYHVHLANGIRWMALYRVAPSAWNVSLSPVSSSSGSGHWRRALKDDYGLSRRQERFCRESPELLPLLSKAAQSALEACQEAFADRRWNCTSLTHAPDLTPDLTAGTKEQAFVYALTSASVAHAVAKACANGALFDCPCGAAPRTHPDGNFKWGGCGDNIAFGVTISKKFLDVLERGRASRVKVEDDEELQSFQPVINRKRSILALVNLHNNRAGRRSLEKSVTQQCKCHGVSGSCNIKTCWRALTKVSEVAQRLKRRYAEATEVTMQRRGVAGRRHLQPTLLTLEKLPASARASYFGGEDLLYTGKSPDYCTEDLKFGSLGTKGRVCNSSEEARDNFDACSSMCCGRGFVLKKKETLERCHCRYHWCCYVKCKTCLRTEFVSQCL